MSDSPEKQQVVQEIRDQLRRLDIGYMQSRKYVDYTVYDTVPRLQEVVAILSGVPRMGRHRQKHDELTFHPNQ